MMEDRSDNENKRICHGSFVCAACIYAYRSLCIPTLFKEQKLLTNKNKMQKVYVVSRPFIPLSCFCCQSNIMYSKMDETIHENCTSIKNLTYTKTKCTIRKNVQFWSRNNINIVHLLCICTRFMPLKDTGIQRNRYAHMRAAHTYKPSRTYIPYIYNGQCRPII
jgi:hypothetical protein